MKVKGQQYYWYVCRTRWGVSVQKGTAHLMVMLFGVPLEIAVQQTACVFCTAL